MSHFITAWVEMTFRGWYSMQCVHPKCQIALTLQPLISKLLGCNFALKFDSHHPIILAFFHHTQMKNVIHLPEEKYCPECVIWSLIDLQKRVIGVNVPPNIHLTVTLRSVYALKTTKDWCGIISYVYYGRQPCTQFVIYLFDDSIGFRNANYSQMQNGKGD